MRSILAASGILAFAVFVSAPAIADETETWRYQCLGDEVVGGRICTTELATFENGEEFIVYFVHTGEGTPPLVVSGENETLTIVTIAVDKNDPLSSETCDSGDCFFSPPHSATLMKQFRKGFRAKVTVRALNRQIVFERRLSLRGFTVALRAPPT